MNDAMSPKYREYWNADVQTQIDADIEKNRKADAKAAIGAPPGAKVKVEQIRHAFIFGAHIFNFDQLGTDERNAKYKALYGHDGLFNSATVAFYWKTLEPEEGHPRFAPEYRDTAAFWNTVKEPKKEPHWRRPAPDPVIDFCESKGIRIHGHPLVWGNYKWHFPAWVNAKLPKEWRDRIDSDSFKDSSPVAAIFNNEEYTPEQLAAMLPEFAVDLETTMATRIARLAFRYGSRVHSWDVCNESAIDFEHGRMVPGAPICQSVYGLMPGDYTYRAFKLADSMLPKGAKLNINDYHLKQSYIDQIADLRARGCKIDIMGAQMHRFNPQQCLDIADGVTDDLSPALEWEKMNRLSQAELPIHLSEITITAPNNDARGQEIQATIARNLYRLWFSTKNMMGITWWNVVDDCGAPGEPSVSGLFSRDMQPKPAYEALNSLINGEWKTKTEVTADADGAISFRGFRGLYRLTWTGADGNASETSLDLA